MRIEHVLLTSLCGERCAASCLLLLLLEREREREREKERKREREKERWRERGDTLLKARVEPTRCVGRVTCASQVVRATACETWQKETERDTQRTENTERKKVCVFFEENRERKSTTLSGAYAQRDSAAAQQPLRTHKVDLRAVQ